jgi:hypothetical protein
LTRDGCQPLSDRPVGDNHRRLDRRCFRTVAIAVGRPGRLRGEIARENERTPEDGCTTASPGTQSQAAKPDDTNQAELPAMSRRNSDLEIYIEIGTRPTIAASDPHVTSGPE